MSQFFSLLNRMKLINRWGLMRNTRQENVAEHSHMVTMLAHALAIIDNEVFKNNVDANLVGMIATYHETSEVITGDLPTPIKYFNKEMIKAYKEIEEKMENKLLEMLPNDLKGSLRPLIQPDKNGYEYKLVKCADKLAAYIKCIEEESSGNQDFSEAKNIIEKEIRGISSPPLQYFLKTFLPSYHQTLDETAK